MPCTEECSIPFLRKSGMKQQDLLLPDNSFLLQACIILFLNLYFSYTFPASFRMFL